MLIGIYKIENKNNGRVYIGSSKYIENRWKQHLSSLQDNTHHCMRLQSDYNKFSILNFNFEVLEICDTTRLLEVEQKWINIYDINDIYNSKKSVKIFDLSKYKNIAMIPKNITSDYRTIHSLRLFIMIMDLIHKDRLDCIEIYASELSEKFGIVHEGIYSNAPSMAEDVFNIQYKNYKMFDSLIYEKGLFSIQLNKKAFDSVLDYSNCINLQIKYDELMKIKNKRTFKLLIALYENNKKLECNLEKFKEIVSAERYSRHANISQKIIAPIIKEFKVFGLDLKLETKKHNKKITDVSFSID